MPDEHAMPGSQPVPAGQPAEEYDVDSDFELGMLELTIEPEVSPVQHALSERIRRMVEEAKLSLTAHGRTPNHNEHAKSPSASNGAGSTAGQDEAGADPKAESAMLKQMVEAEAGPMRDAVSERLGLMAKEAKLQLLMYNEMPDENESEKSYRLFNSTESTARLLTYVTEYVAAGANTSKAFSLAGKNELRNQVNALKESLDETIAPGPEGMQTRRAVLEAAEAFVTFSPQYVSQYVPLHGMNDDQDIASKLNAALQGKPAFDGDSARIVADRLDTVRQSLLSAVRDLDPILERNGKQGEQLKPFDDIEDFQRPKVTSRKKIDGIDELLGTVRALRHLLSDGLQDPGPIVEQNEEQPDDIEISRRVEAMRGNEMKRINALLDEVVDDPTLKRIRAERERAAQPLESRERDVSWQQAEEPPTVLGKRKRNVVEGEASEPLSKKMKMEAEAGQIRDAVSERLGLMAKQAKLRLLMFRETPEDDGQVHAARLGGNLEATMHLLTYATAYVAAEGNASQAFALAGTSELKNQLSALAKCLDEHIAPGPEGMHRRRAVLEAVEEFVPASPQYVPQYDVHDDEDIRDKLNAARGDAQSDPVLQGKPAFDLDAARAVADGLTAIRQSLFNAVQGLEPIVEQHGQQGEQPKPLDDVESFQQAGLMRGAEMERINALLSAVENDPTLTRIRAQGERARAGVDMEPARRDALNVEREAIFHLKEALRQDAVIQRSALPPRAAVRRNAEGRATLSQDDAIAIAIDRILSGSIPDHPAFSGHRVFTVRTIHEAGFSRLDPAGREEVLHKIRQKQPHFGTYMAADVAALHKALVEYRQMKDGDAAEFPFPEVLDHREEQMRLRAHDVGEAETKPGQRDRQKENLAQIRNALDRIIPPMPYYDPLRREVIDKLLKNGWSIFKWEQEQEKISQTLRQPGAYPYYPNEFDDQLVDLLRFVIVPEARALETLKGQYRMDLNEEEALSIDRLIVRHQELTAQAKRRRLGQDQAALRLPEMRRVPAVIEQTVRRDVAGPETPPGRENAEPFAQAVKQSLAAVWPMKRGNFDARCRFLAYVSDRRRALIAPPGRQAPGLPATDCGPFLSLFNKKEPEIEALAASLHRYHRAWAGKAVELPPPATVAEERVTQAQQVKLVPPPLSAEALGKLQRVGQRTIEESFACVPNLDDKGQASEQAARDRGLAPRVRGPSDDRR